MLNQEEDSLGSAIVVKEEKWDEPFDFTYTIKINENVLDNSSNFAGGSPKGPKKDACPRLQCYLCPKTFKNKLTLNNHIKMIHTPYAPVEMFSCPNCPKTFKYKSALYNHLIRVHQEHLYNRIRCEICDKICNGIRGLKLHISLAHFPENQKPRKAPQKVKRPCSQSGKSFWSKDNDAIQCFMCFEEFLSADDLRTHISTHGTQVEYFHCTLCNISFHSKANLKIHENSHFKMFSCFCEEEFFEESALNRHQMENHSVILNEGDGSYEQQSSKEELEFHICLKCGDLFTKKDYEDHLETHHDPSV